MMSVVTESALGVGMGGQEPLYKQLNLWSEIKSLCHHPKPFVQHVIAYEPPLRLYLFGLLAYRCKGHSPRGVILDEESN